MIAVVDASPLCYLVLIGEIDLLPQLFSRVVVPQAVILELRHEDAPAVVQSWATDLPDWIFVEETRDAIFTGMEKAPGWRASRYFSRGVDPGGRYHPR